MKRLCEESGKRILVVVWTPSERIIKNDSSANINVRTGFWKDVRGQRMVGTDWSGFTEEE